MIKSMTGFGKASSEFNNKKFTVEIRSLNSKGVDLNVRMASLYREKELELRNELSRLLERGKIDVGIYFEQNGEEKKLQLNKTLLAAYHKELSEISQSLNIDSQNYLDILLKMPDVMQSTREELDVNEWAFIMTLVHRAIDDFNAFRLQEGAVLGNELSQRIDLIVAHLSDVENLADMRKPQLRAKLNKALEELADRVQVDQNRFEQELIFYLEKLDITEERVRLRTHCNYFLETLNGPVNEGKKLGFICQEIGREINTIGSKCNDADIQRFVVQMKDELEKVKEQVLNIL